MSNLKFDRMFDEIIELLNEEIVRVEQKISDKTIEHLKSIIQEVEIMKRVKNPKQFRPSYTRPLIDCWDYNEDLFKKLMELADLYDRIRK